MKIKIPLNWNRVLHILFMLLLSHSLFSQITVDIKNKPLKDALKEIESKSSLKFFYNNDLEGLNKVVSLKISDGNIDATLSQLLSGSEISYQKQDNNIILLIPKKASSAQEKPKKIKGVIKDEKGETIIGASVVVKGTPVGTVTDIDGSFSLDVPQDATLTISYLGFLPQEIKIGDKMALDITLLENTQALDEVVVVGYGVQKKRDLTGAISSVKLSDEPITTFSTVSHALAGKAAGLRVTQTSAQVGGGSTFRIRGATSPDGGAGNEPLIIIDGFPVNTQKGASGTIDSYYDAGVTDNLLGSLNPNDIESIEVLKDASATAIYGSRAGHGVIIVTTKRGKKGDRLRVNYSGNFGVTNMKSDYKMMDSQQFFQSFEQDLKERFMADNGLGIYADYRTPTGRTLADFDPMATTTYKNSYEAWVANGNASTNWLDHVTRTGIQHSHNISLTGGGETTQYFASINYFDQKGIIKNNSMDRLTAVVNIDQTISKYVKAGMSLNVSRNSYDNSSFGNLENEAAGVLGSALRFTPTIPVYDKNGVLSVDPIKRDFPNPVSLLEITDKSTQDRLLGSVYVEVKPIKELTLKANLGADRKYYKRKQYVPAYIPIGASSGGSARIHQGDNLDYLMELTATYTKKFGNHNLTALAGYSFQQSDEEAFNASAANFPLDSYLYNNIATGQREHRGVGSSATKSALGSYFGRINYTYLERYLLTATLRADGDSDFLPANRWGYFPSVSLGWRFSDEPFMGNFVEKAALSNGKLRVSYGQTGNSNIGNVVYDAYGNRFAYVFGNSVTNGMGITKLGNPDITWETTTEANIGLDLGFFNGRINFTGEWYRRVISDLLSKKTLPTYNEINELKANIGKTLGTGYEFTLNTLNVQTRDFSWTTDLTLQHFEDRWLERSPDWRPSVYEKEGDPIRAIYALKSNGLMQVGEKAPAWQPGLLPGQIKVSNLADESNDLANKIDQYDTYLLGSKDPALIFGFNNTLKYKNFDFNIYLYGELNRWRGQSYYEAWSGGVAGNVVIYNAATSSLNHWQHDNQSSRIPSIVATTTALPRETDYWYKKISYLRCRNITLGYSFSAPKAGIGNARVYVDVNNPFVITNWTGIDPETDAEDGYSHAHPSVTGFNIGIDITF